MKKQYSIQEAPKIPALVTKTYKEKAQKAMVEIAKAVERQLAVQTRASGAVATGEYKRSWRTYRRGLFQIIVENKARHSGFVESGRGPSTKYPPAGAIYLWVKKKLHINDKKTLRRITFLVARKIKRHGFKGRAVMATALSLSKPKIKAIIARHFGK